MSRAPSNAVTPVAGACARDGTVGPARTARAIVAKAATFTQRIEASTLNPDDYTVSRLGRSGKGICGVGSDVLRTRDELRRHPFIPLAQRALDASPVF
jgi:hypothetical protein